jgi:threonine dehydratase
MIDSVPSRAEIDAAAERIAPHVRRTPVIEIDGAQLEIPDVRLVLKLELLQHTGSFKPRGGFNHLISADVPEVGVVAASGGNHGLGVAYAARQLGHRAEIFVPATAPAIKVRRLHELGAHVVQIGEVYDEARQAAEQRAQETGAVIVHAYDQRQIVAGAGTVGRELQQQTADIDTILVSVGGGGLIGGTAAWLREEACVVAVEPECCPTLSSALAAGKPVDVEVGGLATDALGASRIGDIGFASASRWVDESVLVPDASIRRAQWLLWNRLRLIAEPGGATALAGLVSGAFRPRSGGRVAVLVCGGNTDPAVVAGLSG